MSEAVAPVVIAPVVGSGGVTSAPKPPPAPTASAIDLIALAGPKAAATRAAASEPKSAATPEEGSPQQVAAKVEQPAKPAEPEWLEYVADGKKRRVTKEEALKRLLPLADTSYNRLEEAAAMRKQADSVLSRMKDPKKAIEFLQDPELGLKKEEVKAAFEDWYKTNYIDREAMTPEQREHADLKARLSKYEEQEVNQKKEAERKLNEELDSRTAQETQQEIIKTVEESGLPKSKFTVSRIAYWTRLNEAKGINAPRELVIGQVKKELRDVVESVCAAADGDMLFEVLGEATVKKVRSHDLARIRAKRNQVAPVQTPVQDDPFAIRPNERITESEVRRRMREWK